MIKRLVVVVLALVTLALVGSVAGCGGNLPNDAAAKVGDTYISGADFDLLVAQTAGQYGITRESYPEEFKLVQAQAIGTLVEDALAAIKAGELSLTVAEEEIQTGIDEMVALYYGGDQALMEQEALASNLTMDQYKDGYRKYLLTKKVREAVTKDVPAATDEQIAASYEEGKASYYTPESRTVRYILITPGVDSSDTGSTTSTTAGSVTSSTSEVSDAERAEALATANEVRAKLIAGGDWKELAAQYSDDLYSKDEGGDIGEIGKGEMPPEFEEVAFSQAVDEISQPVKTTYGYFIIQVRALTPAVQKTLADVKATIASSLLAQANSEAWLAWLTEMKTKVTIIYRDDLAPVTTTSASVSSETTAPAEQTTTTVAPGTATTVVQP